MMKKTKDSSGAGERDVLPRSIIAMGTRSVNGFCPLKQTPNLGSGPLERGDRVGGISWDYASQCSAGVGAGSRRTTGLSALTRVVSGCRAKKWPQATGPGRIQLFCAPAGLGVTVMERRAAAVAFGVRCH